LGMAGSDGIRPSLPGESRESLPYLDSKQGVVHPALGLVHVAFRRDHVVIAGEDHRLGARGERSCMGDQALQPTQLVIELRSGVRVAIGQIEDRKSTRL